MAGEAPKRHVLIAVDGSEIAKHAFDWFMENCYKEGDSVSVGTAAEIGASLHLGFFGASGIHGDKAVELSKKAAEIKDRNDRMMFVFTKYMKEHGVKGSFKNLYETSKESHKPQEAICHFAVEEKVNMIVMGTRGLGTLSRKVLGSVSDYVVHHAHCPVVVVPYNKEEGNKLMELD